MSEFSTAASDRTDDKINDIVRHPRFHISGVRILKKYQRCQSTEQILLPSPFPFPVPLSLPFHFPSNFLPLPVPSLCSG